MTQTKIKKLIKILAIALTGIGLIAMLVVGAMFLASSEKVTGENQSVVLADSSGTCGDNLTWTLTDEGVLTISGTGEMTNWSLFSDVPWYESRTNINSIVIGSGVTSIGPWAFNNCQISSINIPNSVTIIADKAFFGCNNLTSIEIPSSVTSIGSSAFSYCTNLSSITINGNTEIFNGSPSTFESVNNLTTIYVMSGVTNINWEWTRQIKNLNMIVVDSNNMNYSSQDGVLYNKDKTTLILYPWNKTETSFTVLSSVTSIGNNAFKECSNLQTINLPNGLTNIGHCAFYSCSNLTSINIPNSVTNIGGNAFCYCRSLTSIAIPGSVKNISDGDTLYYSGVFYSCSGLQSVTLGEGIESIGTRAFSYCTNLTSITMPSTMKNIKANAFNSCKALRTVNLNEGLESIGDNAFAYCSNIRSLTLPESLLSIGDETFIHCNSLTSFNISKNVNSIGANIISDCESLTTLTVDSLNTTYNDGNGSNCIIETSEKSLITMTKYADIPNTILKIGNGAFKNCDWITDLFIPYGVKYIGDEAFYDSSLKSITLPSSLLSIGDSAFYFSELKTINIPNSVRSIGDKCFYYYNVLKSVNLGNGVETIGQGVFEGCGKLKSINIPHSVTSIGSSAFYGCSSLTSIEIPSSVISIGDWAFFNCYSLTSINIPSSVESIGYDTFSGCSSLSTITVDSGNTVYNDGNGSNKIIETATGNIIAQGITIKEDSGTCGDNLTWALDNNGVLTISGTGEMTSSPWNSRSVRSVVIEDGVTSIWNGAFKEGTKLTSVSIPNSVTSIGNFAFMDCSNLTSINILSNVTSIGYSTFAGCENLVSINVDENNENYSSQDGILYNKDKTEIICYPAGKTNTVFTIPNSVIIVGASAFYKCNNLEQITVPGSVKDIMDADVRSVNLYTGAFGYCENLETVILSEGLENIGISAFGICSLKTIQIPNSVKNIASRAFFSSGLTSIRIPSNANISSGSYINGIFSGCYELTSVILEEGIEEIGSWAFAQCYKLRSIEIPRSVISIDGYAFNGCSDLKLIFKSTTPPITMDSSGLSNVFVPNSALADYQAALPDYLSIIEGYDPSDQVTIIWQNWDGTTLDEEQVTFADLPVYNSAPPTREATAKYSYEWDGWTLPIELATEDATYTASFTRNGMPYTITYDSNDGTNRTLTQNVIYTGSFTTYNYDAFERAGYKIVGWSKDPNTQTGIYCDVGTYYGFEDTEDITLYAMWSEEYSITYELNGGSVATANRDWYTAATQTFTLVNPTKQYYTFAGWTGSNGSDPETTVTVEKGTTGNLTYTANWTPVEYTISYTLNGGSAENVGTYTVESESITLVNPTKDYYDFTGWTGSNGDEPELNVTIPQGSTGNKGYVANWTPTVYTITTTVDGVDSTQNYTVESESITLTNPSKIGYNFLGWTGSNGEEPELEVVIESGSYGDKEYTANFEAIEYTITYTLNGGVASNPNTYTVESNSITLVNPTKAGYNFVGWTGSNGDEPETTVTISAGSTGNKEYVANWSEAIVYTITYVLNGGEAENPVSYTVESSKITLAQPTRVGATFKGWTGSNGSTAQKSVSINTGSTGDKTYTANWTLISYKLTYTLNGGTVSPANPKNFNVETATFTLNNPTKANYDFLGWTGGGLEEPTLEVTIETGSINARTYVANWAPTEYTITYTLNGGTAENPETYTVESESITLVNPTKLGYNFVGWTGSNGETPQLSVIIPTGSTGNKEYTANWSEPIIYTITYTLNGGTATNPLSYTVESNTITFVNPTKAGYTFLGWTGSNGDEPSLEVIIPQGSSENKEYTANFEVITYTITTTVDGFETTQNYTIESESIILVNPTKAGYTFIGWTGSNGEEPEVEVVIPQGSTGDKVYTANWSEPIIYTITYTLSGGTATNPETYTVESESITLVNPTKVGYTFTGWTGSNGNEPELEVVISQGTTGNKEYVANWSLNQYKITLHIDNEVKVINYNILSKDQVIEKPTKKGYNFLGWTGEDLTEATMDLVIPKGSIGDREYTATWEEAPTNTLAIALGVGIPGGAILIAGVVLIVLAKQKKIKLW